MSSFVYQLSSSTIAGPGKTSNRRPPLFMARVMARVSWSRNHAEHRSEGSPVFEGEAADQTALSLAKSFGADAHSFDPESDTGKGRLGRSIACRRTGETDCGTEPRLVAGIEGRQTRGVSRHEDPLSRPATPADALVSTRSETTAPRLSLARRS